MKVFCISGKARHGKDTAAQDIRKVLWGYGKRVLITHNADLLKYICSSYFGWNGEKDECGRTLLQYVGTDVVRVKRPTFWVDFIADILDLFNDVWDYVIIPDCRFPNEIDSLRQRGLDVTHVKVTRDGFDNGLTDEQKAHISETALDGVAPDYTIDNSGSLVDLLKAVMDFVIPINDAAEKEEERKHA